MLWAIICSRLAKGVVAGSASISPHSRAELTGMWVMSTILRPSIVTARATGFRRVPAHVSHGCSDMYSSIWLRT